LINGNFCQFSSDWCILPYIMILVGEVNIREQWMWLCGIDKICMGVVVCIKQGNKKFICKEFARIERCGEIVDVVGFFMLMTHLQLF